MTSGSIAEDFIIFFNPRFCTFAVYFTMNVDVIATSYLHISGHFMKLSTIFVETQVIFSAVNVGTLPHAPYKGGSKLGSHVSHFRGKGRGRFQHCIQLKHVDVHFKIARTASWSERRDVKPDRRTGSRDC